jgi:transposase
MKKRIKQEYTTEFRERAIKMVISSDKSTAQIAKDLGLKGSTLYSWMNKAKSDNVEDIGKNNEQLFDELKRLKKELAEVKEQRDILKKATAYFAKESL